MIVEDPRRLYVLYDRFLSGSISSSELDELFRHFGTSDETDLRALIEAELLGEDQDVAPSTEEIEMQERVYARLQEHIAPVKRAKVRRLSIYRWSAAAAVVLALSFGLYKVLHGTHEKGQVVKVVLKDISPGTDQATLTLADGRKIVLKKGLNGQLARQGNTVVNVESGSSLQYVTRAAEVKVEYNTLETKRGQESPFPLVLADGTKIWLNAASSITFPTSFVGVTRKVKISGEAYFEVAHNAARPFIVQAGGQSVQVLGTHFDVNAYADEPMMHTTLLEGSVRIMAAGQTVLLKPGQQSVMGRNDGKLSVEPANLKAVMAWRNGMFHFEQADPEEVMRQVARWYDLDVVYEGGARSELYDGEIPRAESLAQALKIIGAGDMHFELVSEAGRKKLIIKP